MRPLPVLICLGAALLVGCDKAKEGKPTGPKVTRPIEIDRDKPSLNGRVPPEPNNKDTATGRAETRSPTTAPSAATAPVP